MYEIEAIKPISSLEASKSYEHELKKIRSIFCYPQHSVVIFLIQFRFQDTTPQKLK